MVLRMPASPPPDSSRPSGRPTSWLPVLVTLAVFAQVAYLGLRPALAEERRLGAAEDELEARLARAENDGRELERLLEAQGDPIYRERERRALLDPAAPAGNGANAPEGSASAGRE